LKQLSQQSATATEQLTSIAEHKSWFAAKLHWSDQKQLAQRVAQAVTERFTALGLDDRIDGIFVYFNDLGFKLDRLQKGVDDANTALAALADGQATILLEQLAKLVVLIEASR
jgi:flagellar biosynthesis/type III secretory pathway chaperone